MLRFLAMTSLVLAACGGKPVLDYDGWLAELRALEKQMCACTTPACADGVQAEYNKWRDTVGETLKKHASEDDPKAAAFDKSAAEIARAIRKCSAAREDKLTAAIDTEAKFRDLICACKDAECARKVKSEHDAWTLDFAKTMTAAERARMTDDVNLAGRSVRLGVEIQDCFEKLTDAGKPAPNP